LVGVVLTPIARRREMPVAAVGFAAVVSMMPGVFLFRMASGLVTLAHGTATSAQLAAATLGDGVTALLIIFAMSLGVIFPKMALDRARPKA
jgi:uncharacterized membrane protein YjjB (DUF3815 family)